MREPSTNQGALDPTPVTQSSENSITCEQQQFAAALGNALAETWLTAHPRASISPVGFTTDGIEVHDQLLD